MLHSHATAGLGHLQAADRQVVGRSPVAGVDDMGRTELRRVYAGVGETTITTSPRLQKGPGGVVVNVDVHLRAFPFLRERRQTLTQLGRCIRTDAVLAKVYGSRQEKCHITRVTSAAQSGASRNSTRPLRKTPSTVLSMVMASCGAV